LPWVRWITRLRACLNASSIDRPGVIALSNACVYSPFASPELSSATLPGAVA